jgi:hypothetical protein
VRTAIRGIGLTVAAVAMLVAADSRPSFAQEPAPPLERSEKPAEKPAVQRPAEPRTYRMTGSRVAIGRSISVPRDEEVTDAVVVIGGSLRVDGRVHNGLVVVGGDVALGPEADVRGDVVLVGGRLTRAEGAQLRGSVSDVTLGDWSGWSLGGLWIPTVDFGDFGRWLALLGALFRISLLALMMAFVLLVARAPVARVGRAVANEPAKAFAIGLAAEVLFLPVLIALCLALIITIVGIPLVVLVIPLAIIAAIFAMVLGFTGLACRLGEWVEDRLGLRANSAFLATAIGTLLVLGPTLSARVIDVTPAPVRYTAFAVLLAGVVIEFVVWTMGLGATLMTGFGRWSTVPPPLPPPAVQQNDIVPVAG